MAKNKLSDLYDHLFECIERLKDPEPETPIDIEIAKQINSMAKTIIDGARIEANLIIKMEEGYKSHLIEKDQKQLQ